MCETDNNHDGAARSSPNTEDQDDQAFPTLALDPDKYRQDLNDSEVTDEQAAEYLQVLWDIMHSMVDMGMGLDDIQMFLPLGVKNTGQDSGKDSTMKDSINLFNEAATTPQKKA